MNKKTIGLICRILLGLVFIASAVLKYLSIEATDMFLFEHKLMPWTLTQFVTRLLIAFEAGLGVLLLLGIKPRLTRILAFLSLIAFTIYLLLKPIWFGGTDENCHCFGNYIRLSHTQSIIKNVVMLLLACMIGWSNGWKTRFATLITIIVAVLATAATIIIYPPDTILTNLYGKEISLDKEGFEELKQLDEVKPLELQKGKKVLCLYSTGCKYCKRTAMKIEVMIQMHDLKRQDFTTIFWGGEKGIQKFRTETQTQPLATALVNPMFFLKATKGKQPVIVLLNEGKIEQIFNSRSLNEEKLVHFLTTP
ncbi:MAG: DoxX family membrane protein [Bacteroidales bacterium]|jgi:uncharacterized membrane protein YphA (DoxX/SURF4 family)|nr:DoxX family membrane protein [Bacteroidales bacterium]